jgi:hypothetical protein
MQSELFYLSLPALSTWVTGGKNRMPTSVRRPSLIKDLLQRCKGFIAHQILETDAERMLRSLAQDVSLTGDAFVQVSIEHDLGHDRIRITGYGADHRPLLNCKSIDVCSFKMLLAHFGCDAQNCICHDPKHIELEPEGCTVTIGARYAYGTMQESLVLSLKFELSSPEEVD